MSTVDEPKKNKKEENSSEESSDQFEVLDVFGLKLKVSNSRLAELLTMEAKEALTTDVKKLVGQETERTKAEPQSLEAKIAEVPTLAGIASLDDYHRAVGAIGKRLGFEVDASGVWHSPSGIAFIVRPVKDYIEVEKAKLYATELFSRLGETGKEVAGLFVVSDQLGVDTFKVAIRAEHLYHALRVISYDNLKEVLLFKENGRLTHAQVVTLMSPLDEIDLGELMNVLKAVASSQSEFEF